MILMSLLTRLIKQLNLSLYVYRGEEKDITLLFPLLLVDSRKWVKGNLVIELNLEILRAVLKGRQQLGTPMVLIPEGRGEALHLELPRRGGAGLATCVRK